MEVKMKIRFIITACYIFLFFMTGCLSRGVVPVSGYKNTFAFDDRFKRDVFVSSVSVWECDSNRISKDHVWEIQTDEKISGENFQVTVGEVPANFYQTIPCPPAIFHPKEEVIYKIFIVHDRPVAHFGPPYRYFYYSK